MSTKSDKYSSTQKVSKYSLSGILKYKKTLGLASLLTGSFLYYGYDHIRLITEAGIRAGRCGYSGIKTIYKYKKYGINPETHEYAADQLYSCFTKNGGCYIKFGQIIAQVHILFITIYIIILY